MANPIAKAISQQDAAGPLSGIEVLAGVQDGRTVKIPVDQIKEFSDTSCQCTLVSRYNEVGIPATTLISYLHTYTLPANTLSTDGSWLDITATGKFAANANFKAAGVIFRQNSISVGGRQTTTNTYNDYYWNIELKFQRKSSSTYMRTAKVAITPYNAGSEVGNNPDMYIDYVVSTIDWTNDLQIVVTGDSSAASANDITCGQFIVVLHKLDPES